MIYNSPVFLAYKLRHLVYTVFLLLQMTVQDLPEAPLSEPASTQDEEKLDLPDVPTKTPEIVADKSQAAKTKGLSLSLLLVG